MDNETLQNSVFPRLARQLAAQREVYMDFEYASHFSHYLRHQWEDLWLRTEQETTMTDDFQARFYLHD